MNWITKMLIMKIKLVFLMQVFAQISGHDVNSNFCRDQGWSLGAFPHPDPQKCSSFVICALYNTYVQECPSDQIFVPHLGADPPYGECLFGSLETCQHATPTIKTSTLVDTTTEFDDSTQTIDNENETTADLELTTDLETNQPTTTSRLQTTTPIPIHRCPPGGFGNIPHHTNCSRYFECIKGIRHLRFCPDNILFDSVTLECTLPELAVCAGEH